MMLFTPPAHILITTTVSPILKTKVRKAIPKKLPRFLEEGGPTMRASLEHSPEFWFGKKLKAGARAHIDAHTEYTITLQLASAKQWRLGMPERRAHPQLKWLYTDGQIYTRYPDKKSGWPALLFTNLYPGDALFIPPGRVLIGF